MLSDHTKASHFRNINTMNTSLILQQTETTTPPPAHVVESSIWHEQSQTFMICSQTRLSHKAKYIIVSCHLQHTQAADVSNSDRAIITRNVSLARVIEKTQSQSAPCPSEIHAFNPGPVIEIFFRCGPTWSKLALLFPSRSCR
jgi:hypothetical protein